MREWDEKKFTRVIRFLVSKRLETSSNSSSSNVPSRARIAAAASASASASAAATATAVAAATAATAATAAATAATTTAAEKGKDNKGPLANGSKTVGVLFKNDKTGGDKPGKKSGGSTENYYKDRGRQPR